MKTLKDVLCFVYDAIDLRTEIEKTRQKYFQAHKCLNNYLQSGIVSDDSVEKAPNKIDKILYIENNEKDHLNPYWEIDKEISELVNIVADLNGCTRH